MFQCPLSGRGLQPLDTIDFIVDREFQCPLSGRGLQPPISTQSGPWRCFNALLAGGVCSHQLVIREHERKFQCPLSGRGLQLRPSTDAYAGRARFQCPLSGRGLQLKYNDTTDVALTGFNALLAGGVCSDL